MKDMRQLVAASAEVYKQKREKQREHLSLSEPVKNGIERIVLLRTRLRYRVSSRAKNKARAAALATVKQTLENANKWNAAKIKKG